MNPSEAGAPVFAGAVDEVLAARIAKHAESSSSDANGKTAPIDGPDNGCGCGDRPCGSIGVGGMVGIVLAVIAAVAGLAVLRLLFRHRR